MVNAVGFGHAAVQPKVEFGSYRNHANIRFAAQNADTVRFGGSDDSSDTPKRMNAWQRLWGSTPRKIITGTGTIAAFYYYPDSTAMLQSLQSLDPSTIPFSKQLVTNVLGFGGNMLIFLGAREAGERVLVGTGQLLANWSESRKARNALSAEDQELATLEKRARIKELREKLGEDGGTEAIDGESGAPVADLDADPTEPTETKS